MPKEGVLLAWGTPSASVTSQKNGAFTESWHYHSQRPVHTQHFGLRHSIDHHRYTQRTRRGVRNYPYYDDPFDHCQPEVIYIPYTSGIVSFKNDRVSSWESTR